MNIKQRTLFILGLATSQANAESLSLDQYLNQIQIGNDQFRASKIASEGAIEKSADGESIYSPNFFATIQAAVDKKELRPTSQRGEQTDYTSAQFGMSKMTSFGTVGKISYSATQTKIKGTSPQFIPEPEWKETFPAIEISHPLWKNAHGEDVSKSIEVQQSQAQIVKLGESFKRKIQLAEAEGFYWRLVLSRESIRVAKENLERARKIVTWNKNRVRAELADQADLIQAEALEEVREIELTMATDEERAAAHAFNTARGETHNIVKEDLLKITPELIENLPIPNRSENREDLQVSILSEKLSSLAGDLAASKYTPSLDLYGSGTFNGRDGESYSKANSNSLKTNHATYAIGIKFNAPITGNIETRVRSGYAKEKEAAVLTTSRKRYENDREWSDLNRKLEESKNRLSLTQRIESTQKRKLSAERDRQSKGRSTMFHVMQAETDYAASQLSVIRNKAEILGIIARMKTFGGAL